MPAIVPATCVPWPLSSFAEAPVVMQFLPLVKEELYLVGPATEPRPGENIRLEDLREVQLLMPRPYNIVRKLVNEAFVRAGMTPRVVAEVESAITLTAAIADGLGSTILPASMARGFVASGMAWQSRIVEPVIEAPLALCQSDHLPLSEPAQAVREILLELVGDLLVDGGTGLPVEMAVDSAP